MKGNFLHADKHKVSYKLVKRFLMWMFKQIASLQCLYSISKTKSEMKLIFLHADKHQSFLQVDFSIFGIKVYDKVILSLLMDMTRYSQSTHSKKFAISLQ